MIFQFYRYVANQFRILIKYIDEDMRETDEDKKLHLEAAFRSMYDGDINQSMAKIREKFGLLTLEAWWILVFRTFSGRASVIFVDLIQEFRENHEYLEMPVWELFKYIARSPRWREQVNETEDEVTNGMGPWKGDTPPD